MIRLSRRELVLLAVVFLASLPAVTTRLYSSDEVQYFSYLRSLWFDQDVSFDNEYRYFYDRRIAQTPDFHETFLVRETDAGRRINFATIGCALLWSPFYALADVATRLRGGTADGFSPPYVAAVAYGSACYGFAAIVLSIGLARRVAGPEALKAGLAVWAGTPLLFYMYVAPPFSHACSAFAVALLVTIWVHVRREWSPRGAVALGLAVALAAMVREQDIVFALGPAADFLVTTIRRRPRGSGPDLADLPDGPVARPLRVATAGVASCAIGYLPQLLAGRALNGHFGPSHLVTRKMTWSAPHALQVLFDTEHGFLAWTPLAILCLTGLLVLVTAGTRDERQLGAGALLMVALQVYISGAVESWTVAGAFGQRRFVALTPLLVLGLAALWRLARPRAWRWTLTMATMLCVWWNVALIAQFGIRLMDRQRLDLPRNAYHAFVTLPAMAPGLAYRYFTNRGSFYQVPESGSPR